MAVPRDSVIWRPPKSLRIVERIDMYAYRNGLSRAGAMCVLLTKALDDLKEPMPGDNYPLR